MFSPFNKGTTPPALNTYKVIPAYKEVQRPTCCPDNQGLMSLLNIGDKVIKKL